MSAHIVPEGGTKINSTTIPLKTGDKFKIELNVSKEGYVYIYGVDSEGQFEELIGLGKSKHYFKIGNHILPPNGSFELLGNGKMKEELYFVVNKNKLNVPKNVSGLETLFAELKNNNPQIIASTKGIGYVSSATFAPKNMEKRMLIVQNQYVLLD
jgi:hypothetical protein